MADPIRIGIIGDYDPNLRTHVATNAAFRHAAVEIRWLATQSLLDQSAEQRLSNCDGLFAAAGTPYASMAGALRAIQFARLRDRPFLGTCGGFQHALIEFARNVLGIADADSAEHGSSSATVVISPVSCAAPNRLAGGPMLSGHDRILLLPDSRLLRIYGRRESSEEFHCNYEVNAGYQERFVSAGMLIAAVASDGRVRAFELPEKKFFIGTLFQPQLALLADAPHPLIAAFVDAARGAKPSSHQPGNP